MKSHKGELFPCSCTHLNKQVSSVTHLHFAKTKQFPFFFLYILSLVTFKHLHVIDYQGSINTNSGIKIIRQYFEKIYTAMYLIEVKTSYYI